MLFLFDYKNEIENIFSVLFGIKTIVEKNFILFILSYISFT